MPNLYADARRQCFSAGQLTRREGTDFYYVK
jgi:hypothetical protein